MSRPRLVIVTPAWAEANNGNWQTAQRWARLLAPAYRVRLCGQWEADASDDLMLALHARRSAPSIASWAQARGPGRLAVVLTGTDLYRDIDHDPVAQRSLDLADRLLVLNERASQRLPVPLQPKARVVLQSCSERRTLVKSPRRLRVVVVGHLREEKDPATVWRAVRRLAHRPDIVWDHLGRALAPHWAEQALALQAEVPQFRWRGDVPHGRARQFIQRAHVLVHPSLMEGGAHVVIEAMRSGTPVLASRVDGNLGLLGDDHPACFDTGDDAALARALEDARDHPAMLAVWQAHGARRAPLFSPESERSALLAALGGLS